MRGAWERGLAKLELGDKLQGKTVSVVEGSFEDFRKSGVQKGTVDLVVIAQAWHWCPDHEAAFVSVWLGVCEDGRVTARGAETTWESVLWTRDRLT